MDWGEQYGLLECLDVVVGSYVMFSESLDGACLVVGDEEECQTGEGAQDVRDDERVTVGHRGGRASVYIVDNAGACVLLLDARKFEPY